ncbi:MAG: ATP-binding protein [Chloroflexota bacterium]|nr:ATP-binding protein [Chloroflexota bacterium]
MSIRLRLTTWYGLTLALALAIVASALVLVFQATMERQLDADLAARAATVASGLQGDETLTLQQQGGDQSFVVGGEVVALYDATGKLSDATARPSWLGQSVAAFAAGTTVQREQTITIGAEHLRVLALPIVDRGSRIGVAVVVRSLAPIDAAARQLVAVLGLALPVAVGLAAVGGYFLADRALRPMEQLRQAADEYSAHDLTRRLAPGRMRDDELGRLAHTLDAMLDRVAAAVEQQRRFTGDASHELRTPVATILADASLALERHRDSDEYRAALERIQAEAVRMGRIVDGLLTLARADAPAAAPQVERLDIARLVDAAVARVAGRAAERQIAVRAQTVPDLRVLGDATGLERVLDNLLDNALRFAPAGSVIDLRVARDRTRARITVADHGPGVPASERSLVFERFHRAAGSRGPGAGLGLAIARAVVDAHEGAISVAETPGGGATFVVELPLVTT